MRLREEDRLGLAELERIIVNPGGAIPIPLSAVADIRVGEGPSEIRRIDQQRAALITANIQGVDLGTASGRIYAALRQMEFPTGFDFIISGQNEEMETSLNSLYFALGLAIFLVYVVMASQFEVAHTSVRYHVYGASGSDRRAADASCHAGGSEHCGFYRI